MCIVRPRKDTARRPTKSEMKEVGWQWHDTIFLCSFNFSLALDGGFKATAFRYFGRGSLGGLNEHWGFEVGGNATLVDGGYTLLMIDRYGKCVDMRTFGSYVKF